MRFFSGVTLAKLDPNLVKTETSKLSLGIISSGGFDLFYTCKIVLGILDTEVVLDSYTLLNVSYLFFMELIDVLTVSPLFLMGVMYS